MIAVARTEVSKAVKSECKEKENIARTKVAAQHEKRKVQADREAQVYGKKLKIQNELQNVGWSVD